jgi:lipopolysaccharide transport system permease protein
MSISIENRREWVIRPRRTGLLSLAKELWEYRALLEFLMANAVLQLHRKKLLGVAWLAIRPIVTLVASVFVVGKVLGISAGPVPLLLFTVIGLALWTLFNSGLRYGTRAISRARFLVGRFNFPRVMLLLAALIPALVEFAVVLVGAVLMLSYFAYAGTFTPTVGWRVVAMIPVLIFVMVIVVAVCSVTSVLNELAADTALGVNYGAAAVLVVTPALYPLAAVPEPWHWVMLLNPLAPAMEIWRWALLGAAPPPLWSVATAAILVFILLVGGLTFFLRWEATILDRS